MSQYSFECQAEADYWLQGPEENAPEIDEINYTGQTVYEQLQEMLNKCIELGRLNKIFDKGCYVLEDGVYRDKGRIPMFSFHDLFSKDSGIMELVEWRIGDVLDNYLEMADKTAEHKVYYFVKNAIIPTK